MTAVEGGDHQGQSGSGRGQIHGCRHLVVLAGWDQNRLGLGMRKLGLGFCLGSRTTGREKQGSVVPGEHRGHILEASLSQRGVSGGVSRLQRLDLCGGHRGLGRVPLSAQN